VVRARHSTVRSDPRWRRRPEARPEEILRAALAEFGRAGYARARLSDIARRAGVSKATLYLYFASKQALLRALLQSQARAWLGPPDAAVGFFPDTAQKKLRRFLRDIWAALRRPEMVQLLRLAHAELGDSPELSRWFFDQVILRIRARLQSLLEAGRARGEFRPIPHDVALHAVPSLLIHQALLREGLAEPDPTALTDEQLVEGGTDLLLNGLLRRSGRTDAE
jgi:AcrR family transcriptional regulator